MHLFSWYCNNSQVRPITEGLKKKSFSLVWSGFKVFCAHHGEVFKCWWTLIPVFWANWSKGTAAGYLKCTVTQLPTAERIKMNETAFVNLLLFHDNLYPSRNRISITLWNAMVRWLVHTSVIKVHTWTMQWYVSLNLSDAKQKVHNATCTTIKSTVSMYVSS